MTGCRPRPPVCTRYQRAAELLGRRWSAAVIRVTMDGPARFTEIRSSVHGLSARLLAERLRELEGAGLIERRPAGSGAVEYRLTPKGEALSQVIRSIEAWVEDWEAEAPGDAGGGGPAGARSPAPRRSPPAR